MVAKTFSGVTVVPLRRGQDKLVLPRCPGTLANRYFISVSLFFFFVVCCMSVCSSIICPFRFAHHPLLSRRTLICNQYPSLKRHLLKSFIDRILCFLLSFISQQDQLIHWLTATDTFYITPLWFCPQTTVSPCSNPNLCKPLFYLFCYFLSERAIAVSVSHAFIPRVTLCPSFTLQSCFLES